MTTPHSIFATPRPDVIAGIVVFLVALPLCLGIALASGVPPVSGLVAGVVGGLVIPLWSRSALSVSGPAAGLASIVVVEVATLGGLAPFLMAVMLAGGMQFTLGLLKAGRWSAMVPSSVIKGMLAAIGIAIITKQIPAALGVVGGFSHIFTTTPNAGSVLIAVISLVILYGWRRTPLGRIAVLSPALVVVVLSSLLAGALAAVPSLALGPSGFVTVPLGGLSALAAAVPRPDFAAVLRVDVWIAALSLAVVASIETLLSLQAVDRIDPLRRHSPPDRELLAQGMGNVVSGFLGGLPVTAVIVRSGANVSAGGRGRLATIVHGLLLLVAVAFAGALLNQIPLAALAAVLIQVGLNLCKPALFKAQFKLGVNQWAPFALTIIAVMVTDLLKGVIVGVVVGFGFVLRQNVQGALVASTDVDGAVRLRFRRDATFIIKPALMAALDEVDDGARIVIDATDEYMDQDVKEALAAFVDDASHRNIKVELVGFTVNGSSGH
jgi:MFS superfamily sulfate permease-like transporter